MSDYNFSNFFIYLERNILRKEKTIKNNLIYFANNFKKLFKETFSNNKKFFLSNKMDQAKKYLIDLDDYEIGAKIGEGSFSTVYECTKKETGELFAAKQMWIDSDDKDRKMYFNREIGIMARIRHPTLIKLYGYSIDEVDEKLLLTIIMDISKKGCLQKSFSKISKNNTIKQKILVGIARGMMYLHEHQIIFRDLKPLNVLLDENNLPLITDFGYAKIISTHDTLRNTQAAGSLYTMAPEVMKDEVYNGKADVYSFGILMFQVVTNSMPFAELYKEFSNLGFMKFIELVANEGRRPVFNKKVKKSIKNLIEKCWSNNPTERPTFEEIFYKLAYNSTDSVYDDLFDDNDENSYYLDGVDKGEILAYADSIMIDDTLVSDSIIDSINDLKKQIKEIKEENEEDFQQIIEENKKIKNENKNLKKERKEIENQIKNLEKELSELAEKVPKSSKKYPKKSDADSDVPTKNDHECHITDCLYKSPDFNGIMKYLTKLTHGNIHDNGTITITSNHSYSDSTNFLPRNIVDYNNNNNGYMSDDFGSSYLLFNFKKRRVQINGYIIKSSSKQGSSAFLKNWKVDVSNDNETWIPLDKQNNSLALNGVNKVAAFKVNKKLDEFYKYVRITQVGRTYYNRNNHNMFYINMIDFFGKIKEP